MAAIAKRAPRLSLPPVIPAATPVVLTGELPPLSWVRVTPQVAMNWLDCNIDNRRVREDYVSRLAADISNGKWEMNGEPIKFNTNGHMFEGQHRCWACVLSGVPFDTLLITGLPPHSFRTSGIGRPKNYGDLTGKHEKNVHLLGAAIRLVYFWQRGMLGKSNIKQSAPTIAQLDETLSDHPKLRESVARAAGLGQTRKLLTSSYVALIHYAGTLEGKHALVESFLERLGNGLGLLDDDPVYQLRRYLLAQKGPHPGRRRAGQEYVLGLAIKAWNASKIGKSMRGLKFIVGEEFPQL